MLIRQHSNRQSTEKTVKELPRSLYHRQYLHGLSPAQLAELEIKPKETPYFDRWATAAEPDSDTEPEL
jgi:hypothetical protein